MSFNIVSGGVVRHVMYCRYPGQVATNKRDWQCVSISGGAVIASGPVLAALDLMLSADFINLMSEDAGYYGSQLYYQTPVGLRPRPESTTVNANNGVDAAHALPPQASGLISLYTDTLGKIGQGRIYVPFPSTLSMDVDGTPTAAYVTQLDIMGVHLRTPKSVTSGGTTAIFNPVLYIPGGDPPKQIIQHISRKGWATQRRRGNFGKLNALPF